MLPSFMRSLDNNEFTHSQIHKYKNKRTMGREREREKHIYIYFYAYISFGRLFFMIVVIINIMSWRHTFLASAQ